MAEATDLKNGSTFVDGGKPFIVTKYEIQKIGRGGANVKLVVRNLENGNLEKKTYNSTHKLEKISTLKKELQYLYNDGVTASFMDPITFDQVEIPLAVVSDQIAYVKEGQSVNVLFWDDKALSVEIAPKVTLEVVETAPGVKGNSATNIYKPAVLENGLTVKVPLFIKAGEKIRVDTRTSEYIERAN